MISSRNTERRQKAILSDPNANRKQNRLRYWWSDDSDRCKKRDLRLRTHINCLPSV